MKRIVIGVLALSTTLLADVAMAAQLKPLWLFWNSSNLDNATVTDPFFDRSYAGYVRARVEGCVFDAPAPNTVPLELFYSFNRRDFFSTATQQGINSAIDAGYQFKGVQGYVYQTQQPGTVDLELWWSAARNDNFTTATDVGKQSAQQAGYSFVRVEGWVSPATFCSG